MNPDRLDDEQIAELLLQEFGSPDLLDEWPAWVRVARAARRLLIHEHEPHHS